MNNSFWRTFAFFNLFTRNKIVQFILTTSVATLSYYKYCSHKMCMRQCNKIWAYGNSLSTWFLWLKLISYHLICLWVYQLREKEWNHQHWGKSRKITDLEHFPKKFRGLLSQMVCPLFMEGKKQFSDAINFFCLKRISFTSWEAKISRVV